MKKKTREIKNGDTVYTTIPYAIELDRNPFGPSRENIRIRQGAPCKVISDPLVAFRGDVLEAMAGAQRFYVQFELTPFISIEMCVKEDGITL